MNFDKQFSNDTIAQRALALANIELLAKRQGCHIMKVIDDLINAKAPQELSTILDHELLQWSKQALERANTNA